MPNSSNIAIGDSPMQTHAEVLQDRLLKTGIIGAGALTITWWALIACGLWQAFAGAGV